MEQRLVVVTLTLSYFALAAGAIGIFPVTLNCVYNNPSSSYRFKEKIRVLSTTHLNRSITLYSLQGNSTNDEVLFVKKVECQGPPPKVGACSNTFGTYILLPQFSDDTLLKIEPSHNFLKLLQLMLAQNYTDQFNLNCALVESFTTMRPGPFNTDGFSHTGLFGYVFMGVCAVLICGFCTLWTTVLYYRRCIQHRKERQMRRALARSTEEMLAKSPVIIFEENAHDHGEEDPMCAICLESFKSKDRIRKLVCEHSYHIACIDPWLLSHQSCPLCNRNILQNPIPSISSSVMTIRNDRVTSNVNTRITQIANSNL